MKITCGTDIIEIDRIKKCIEEGEKFKNKVFTQNEIEYCESKNKQKYQHYAARFAGKEATFKAISNMLDNKYQISWKDIEIKNNQQGKPQVKISNLEKIKNNIEDMDISLSHCKNYAVANVTIIIK